MRRKAYRQEVELRPSIGKYDLMSGFQGVMSDAQTCASPWTVKTRVCSSIHTLSSSKMQRKPPKFMDLAGSDWCRAAPAFNYAPCTMMTCFKIACKSGSWRALHTLDFAGSKVAPMRSTGLIISLDPPPSSNTPFSKGYLRSSQLHLS